MDDGGEGISWMGNMVQKFEDLFSEVDGVMRQELTAVTNQLQTAGANVMQFCMDLVEDKLPQSSENTEKELASDIDIVDSDASKISIDEDHCEKESCDENHLLCSSSMEPIDCIQFEPSVEKNVDTRVYKKSEVIGKENVVKDKHSQHQMSLAVSLKEDKQHEVSDVVSPKKEWSNNIEDASYYISSPTSLSCFDYSYESIPDAEVTPSVASTESPDDTIAQGISDNDVAEPEADTIQSFQEVKHDDSSLEEEDDLRYIETLVEIFSNARGQDMESILEILASAKRQQSHISFLRREKPHYSMMKTLTQNLDQIVQEEEKLREFLKSLEKEACDSDWVIV